MTTAWAAGSRQWAASINHCLGMNDQYWNPIGLSVKDQYWNPIGLSVYDEYWNTVGLSVNDQY